MVNDFIQILISSIPVCIGALITVIFSIIIERIKTKKEIIKDKNNYDRKVHEKYINELKDYCKCITKYIRYMNGLCATFQLVLDKKIPYQNFYELSGRLNELEIDEIELKQKLFFSSDTTDLFNEITGMLRNIFASICFSEENMKNIDINVYNKLYGQFTKIGIKHHKEIISLIKMEMKKDY